jgi:tetrahydromethanopterin S-methyltransferase subunit G
MEGKKIGEKIAVVISLVIALCLLALAIAGTAKLVIWMLS